MANPVVRGTHSAPGQFAGTIHFLGQWAYLEDKEHSDWSLLQYDTPFTGVVDPVVAATTASQLRSSCNDRDQVSFHGVLGDQSFDVVSLYVLFLC